ncbi:DNA polymerase I [Candidatus Blochmanniella vafra str. BVAF]|uniref:DNA polymerase I n=1 Tax=Blochmanniella vafra (strain BVAF) TaxID=859654 RepID=E8Q796_BLOVB|nr:DNA polymerase I [Candidatus Blochmannia vafer]ADV33991.1 DNA polymerase I [Candidatus Blochmannia vafer str. BVAF]
MTNIIDNPIILIDGSFYIYRAYHAYPPLTTSTGYPVWVIYGVINMIRSLLIKYRPIHMGIVFDSPGKTFRNDLFKQYKSNRPQMPEDLCIQITPLNTIIKAMGITALSVPYVEADDVIATLSNFYAQLKNKTVLISTGDKDMAQIVSSNIILINTMSNIILDSLEIKKKFGVSPNLIADYLALIGDRSDNIPGVPGIGIKNAKILLNNIGNLQTLYQNLHKISILNLRNSQSIKNTLIKNKKLAFLSYKLATVKIDVPLNQSDYKLLIQNIDSQQLFLLFKKYEFNTWVSELQAGTWLKKYKNTKKSSTQNSQLSNTSLISNTITHTCNYYPSFPSSNNNDIISNISSLTNWIKQNNTHHCFILNIYSNNFDIFTPNIIGICISTYTMNSMHNAYIPINIQHTLNIDNNNDTYQWYLNLTEVLSILKPILENIKIKKIGHNMKFIFSLLKQHNIHLSGPIFDVILELYVLYGTSNYQNIKRFLNKTTILDHIFKFQQIYNNNKYLIKKNIRDIQLESSCSTQLIYAISNLHQILWTEIKQHNELKKIFINIEIPLISVLSRIEDYGVLIDKKFLYSHSIKLNSQLNNLKTQAYQLTGSSFNLDSPKQLQEILYNQEKLPIFKKTPHGAPSTSEEVLKKLSKKHSIPKIILKYRSLSKLKSTYTNKLISMINKKSNRIHTSYNQTRTSTGRLSSTNPNLQNIPNRNYDGRKIRQAFIAPENSLIISADYSQIELRIMAHLSRDLKLINDFLEEKDIHTTTASEIFVTSLHLVTGEQRQRAKTVNFGLIYGMTAFGLSKQLSVTCQEAQKYVDRYFQRYPGVMQYMQYIKDYAKKNGYVSTLDGRKLYLPDIYSSNISQKKGAERSAINAPMQGSAADIIKRAMISIDSWLQTDNIPVHMIMQVHDELVFEVNNTFVDIAVKQIRKLMEECFILNVPLKVDIGVGKNWEQAH